MSSGKHGSGTGIPRVGEGFVPWERAHDLVWSNLRQLEARYRETLSGVREIGSELRSIDRHLAEAKAVDKGLLEDLAELRDKIRRLVENDLAALRTDSAATKMRVHSLEQAAEIEDRVEARVDRRIRLSRGQLAAGGTGLAAIVWAVIEGIRHAGRLLGWWG